MNSRERVTAVITGQPVDRLPVSPVLCLYGARLTGCPVGAYFSNPAEYARGQAAVLDAFSPDILFGPFAFAKIGAAFGSQVREFPESAPNVRRPAISSADEINRLVIPDLDSNTHLTYFYEALSQMVVNTRKEAPIAAVLPSPPDLPALIMGMDAWMELVLFDRDNALRMLDLTQPFWVEFCNRLFEIGADFAVMPCAFGSSTVVTRAIAKTFTKPILMDCFSLLKGPVAFHHGGAPLLDFLDMYTDLPNVIGVGMDHQDNLACAREIIGSERVLFGGIFGPGLASQTPFAIETFCREVLEDRKDDPRFILYTSGPDIPFQTSPENIRAIFSAVECPG